MNKERLLQTFSDLVSIYSPSLNEREICDYISSRLIELGFSIHEDSVGEKIGGNCGNLYGFLEGDEDEKPLVFCAHMDTVEPSLGKKAILHDDGTISSDGTTILGADDLSGLSAILEAVSTIKEDNINHRPIEVLFCVGEEIYGLGSRYFDFSLLKSKESYTLDLSGNIGSAANKAPTILSFTVTVYGKAAHASFTVKDSINSIAIASQAISQIKLGQVDFESTCNIGVINGGLASNIVPELSVVKGEIRSYSHKKANDILEDIQKTFLKVSNSYNGNVEFESEINVEAYETPLNHAVVKRFQKVCDKLAIPCYIGSTFGGSDNNNIEKHGIHGLVLASAMNRCHSCEETSNVFELEKITNILIELMKGDK